METTWSSAILAGSLTPPSFHRHISPAGEKLRQLRKSKFSESSTKRQSFALLASSKSTTNLKNGVVTVENIDSEVEKESNKSLSLKDYFKQSEHLFRSDGGPPRWFSPLECASQLDNSPLLLSLPAIDGLGLILTLHFQRLGKIFDIWCLHIPIDDRTPFPELVKLVVGTIRSEHYHSPKRPIYLVAESFGGCLALAVASCCPDIDLLLVLANPATSFSKSQLQPLIPLLGSMPDISRIGVPYMLSFLADIPSKMVMGTLDKRLPVQQTIEELTDASIALSSYLSVMSDVLSTESLLWKLKMVKSASAYANSRLHAVKSETLVLSSGRDQMLPSVEEGERLRKVLPKCKVRTFNDSGHAFFLEHAHDLVSIIIGTSFYRRGAYHNYASDYIPPSPSEFRKICESMSWLENVTSPVVLSTLESREIVRGLAGIPKEGPVLYVGNHMMLGLELAPLVTRFMVERDILLRGIAHPLMFTKLKEGNLPDVSSFDFIRVMGAVPVSATNFYRLFSINSHILLYPGGVREALHRKGEEYKLFWPEQSEFIRMAARFGAKIIPFGAVGEDDIFQLLLDYNDQAKIPFLKSFYEELSKEAVKLRSDSIGEVTNQEQHMPVLLPKLPGRFYYLFGKPIETAGRKQELKSREKSHELYLEVQSEVQRCLAYLKDKRKYDPYRNIVQRLVYQARHGSESEVPTFDH